jgi:hypothetical protein
MKFTNLKTCQGLESYLFWNGGLLRLSLLPETLRKLPKKDLNRILETLTLRGIAQQLAIEWERELAELDLLSPA